MFLECLHILSKSKSFRYNFHCALMNLKRPAESEITSDPAPKRRFPGNATLSDEDLAYVETCFRKMVREELARILPIILESSPTSLNNQMQSHEEARLRLQFITTLPASVFTGNKIQGNHHSPVLIELTDTRTGSRVTTGPLSSLKIDIVALKGDFDPDNSNFNDGIAKEREGKRPLLNGDLTVTLTQGLGCLEKVTFTDNSSWIPCGKFKLGAMVSRKSRVKDRIQEALSDAFTVKDERGKRYKKHHPPYPNDKLWRLNEIAKDSVYCKRLESIGVRTVEDFLRRLETDPSLMKRTLGRQGRDISNKRWESIVKHATECKIDNHETNIASSSELANPQLLFDGVTDATFDGVENCPVEKLYVPQTHLSQRAFENPNQLTPGRELPEVTIDPVERFLRQQDLPEFSSPTFCYEASGIESQFSDVSFPQIHLSDDTQPVDQRLHGANNFGPGTKFADQNGPQFVYPSTSWEHQYYYGSNHEELETEYLNFSFHNHGHPTRSKVAWCKLRATLKWRIVWCKIRARSNPVAMRQQVFCP